MILSVFPFQAELDAFLPASPGRKEFKPQGIRVFMSDADPEWRLAVCGQGKVEAALACQILSQALQPDTVLLVGSATALDPALRLGDIVVADACIEWDFDADPVPRLKATHAFPEDPGVIIGPILSADRNVFDAQEKRKLFERYAAKALAWEGAGFHRFLRRGGKRGWEIRVVTETAGDGRIGLAELRMRMERFFPGVISVIRKLPGKKGVK